jgi:hypothetical protein
MKLKEEGEGWKRRLRSGRTRRRREKKKSKKVTRVGKEE